MSNGAHFFSRLVFCLLATGACASPAGNNRPNGNTGANTSVGGSTGQGARPNNGGGTAGNGGGIKVPTEVTPGCGNGMHDSNEECDDGNKMGGDGCAPSCRVETDWICPEVGPCSKTAVCGDGKLASTEVCDDGNANPGDGCSANCGAVEDGYQCRVPGKKCVPLCGDRKLTGTENCDDGNAVSGDGCSSTCLTEPGWSCDATGKCVQSVCGNGMKEAGESCDKGDQNGLFFGDATGCSKTCTQEPNCREGGTTSACKTPCGDANIDPGEDCDDGNQVDGDGCSKACKVEAGFMCMAEEKKDTQPCTAGTGECLVLPIIYRDFDGQNVTGTGHPDFFYLGSAGTTCVPNASGQTDALPFTAGGRCWSTDSTDLCQGLVQANLAADGKPALGAAKMCACRFTDWDPPNIITTGGQSCTTDQDPRQRIQTNVAVIKSADTFKEWYHDGMGGTNGTKFVDKLELAQLSGNQYQFSSSNGRTVYDDLHDIFMGTGVATGLTSGFFPAVLDASPRTKVCNLWPYWAPNTSCVATTGAQPPQQWDPRGSYTAQTAGTGGPVTPVTGVKRNFYFTSEVRYLFRFVGGETLSFYGDDDVWVFVNGHLVLDLGAPHERLQGTVTLPAAGGTTATSAIKARNITTGMDIAITNPKPMSDPLGLEVGKTYEIAVFHADRHPRESNYQLTLSGFSTSRSSCAPRCGDGVTTAAEECDDGPMNMDGVYGGCTTMCKFGPFCGDGNPDAAGGEECDLGRDNGATYGQMGCTAGCKKPHFCGDHNLDGDKGEECDDGDANGMSNCDKTCHLLVK